MAILTVLILLILEKKPSFLMVPQLSHMWMGPVFLAFLPFCLHSGKPRSRYSVNSTGEHAEDQDGDPRYGLCSCSMGTGPLSAQTFFPLRSPIPLLHLVGVSGRLTWDCGTHLWLSLLFGSMILLWAVWLVGQAGD